MANHSKCPQQLYEEAELLGSFKTLIFYPCLLFRWQYKHPESVKRIATLSSHQLGRHFYCENEEKCAIVEKFIEEQKPGQTEIPLVVINQ